MNARQKAKHFKRLYERTLPQRNIPVIKMEQYKGYTISKLVPEEDVINAAQAVQNIHWFREFVIDSIVKELKPIIWKNLRAEKEPFTRSCKYTLDIWFRL